METLSVFVGFAFLFVVGAIVGSKLTQQYMGRRTDESIDQRDYFAAEAMSAFIISKYDYNGSIGHIYNGSIGHIDAIKKWSYIMADAMIEESKVNGGSEK